MRTVSPIDICNIALAHIGDRRISRLDDDAATDDALVRYCAEFYDQARTEALETQNWSFAKKTAPMSRRTGVVTIGYSHAQVLPEDNLRLISLHRGSIDPNTNAVNYSKTKIDKFEIVGRDVWTDYETVGIKYIKDTTDPTEWSSHFRAAVARLLASFLAGPVADDPRMVTKQKEIYESVDLPNAQYYDAVQDRSGENADTQTRRAGSEFLGVRYEGGNGYHSDGTPYGE